MIGTLHSDKKFFASAPDILYNRVILFNRSCRLGFGMAGAMFYARKTIFIDRRADFQ